MHLLLAGVLVSVGLACREWLYGTTYRCLLTQRADAAPASTATERFDLESDGVVPLIFMQDDRVTFPAGLSRAATLRAEFRPAGAAGYVVRADGRELCRGSGERSQPLACMVPGGAAAIDVSVSGRAALADLRLDRHTRAPLAAMIAIALLAVSWFLARRRPAWHVTIRARRAWSATVMVLTTTTVGL